VWFLIFYWDWFENFIFCNFWFINEFQSRFSLRFSLQKIWIFSNIFLTVPLFLWDHHQGKNQQEKAKSIRDRKKKKKRSTKGWKLKIAFVTRSVKFIPWCFQSNFFSSNKKNSTTTTFQFSLVIIIINAKSKAKRKVWIVESLKKWFDGVLIFFFFDFLKKPCLFDDLIFYLLLIFSALLQSFTFFRPFIPFFFFCDRMNL